MDRTQASGSAALRWLRDTVAIVGDAEGGTIAELARSIPPVAGVVTVVGQLSGPADWRAVAESLPIAVPPRTSAMLAVAGAGSAAVGVAGPAPAAVVAEQLGSEVLAPAGRLLLVPGAALFAVEGFRRFRPGAAPVPAGRRHPAPAWEAAIDSLSAGGSHGLTRVAIPAGLWVYPQRPDTTAPGPDDLAYAIPVDVERPVLLVGRPGHPTPDVDEVAAVVDALPVELRTRLIVVPYGPGAMVCRELTRTLCDRWRGTVTMATGLPTLDTAGRTVAIAVDAEPARCWPQPVRQIVFPPSGVPRVIGPVEALASLASAGSAPAETTIYRWNERWVVEAVQCGLWVRPPFAGRHGPVVRDRPWNPGRLEVFVGVPGNPPGDDVRSVIHELLARLPAAARRRVVISPVKVARDLGLGLAPSNDAPDIVLVNDGTEPPEWWRADPRLFSVLVGSAAGDQVVTQAGEVGPGELGEIVATHDGWAGRPILLLSADPVPREFCQRLSDQLQAAVVNGGPPNGDWSAVLPRRIGRDEPRSVQLTGAFPFPDDDLTALVEVPLGESARAGRPADFGIRSTLDLRVKRDAAGEVHHRDAMPPTTTPMPDPVLVVGRGPDADRPFRLFDIPAGVWFVATAVATQRPGWAHSGVRIRLDVEQIDQVNLQLLANYLGAEVMVPADRLHDHSGGDTAGLWHTRSRSPAAHRSDPARAYADLPQAEHPDVTAGIRYAVALRGLPDRAVPADPPVARALLERPAPVSRPAAGGEQAWAPVEAPGDRAGPASGGPLVNRIHQRADDAGLADSEADDVTEQSAHPTAEVIPAGVAPAEVEAGEPDEVESGPAAAITECDAGKPEALVTPGPARQKPVTDRPPALIPVPVPALSAPTVPLRVSAPAEQPATLHTRRNVRAGLVAAAFVAIVALASGAVTQLLDADDAVAEPPPPNLQVTTALAPTLAATPGADSVGSATPPITPVGSTPAIASSTVAVSRTEPAPGPTTAGPPAPVRTTAPAPAPVRTTAPATPVSGRTNSGGRNLALGASATASSIEGTNWAAKLAVDGDGSTRWSSAWQDPQWIKVDLGENWVVTEVRLSWESAHASAYRVELSRDGVNWTTVFSTSNGTGGSLVVDVPSLVARYVRMYGTSRSGTYGYSLYELEVR
ncbi:discoidin domain-containing protein [Solwaraspora sp. WMMA2080]|uniref:discoidin domain-containing protein n=1 Tax=unclassified Solwaraspora TaxID=2627926 RepID=UPI00248AA20A|nr:MULTISPECIES: discoidin domain-containing protein [unclassified Solwaraspora]WBB96717.1 discoidin domain-containing protein [Solwaraspora sp. WMMA2059]WBC19379.1 discoidin domain-containing protein [Solwaraspora sp. WMMA2080]